MIGRRSLLGAAAALTGARTNKDSPNILYCLADDWSWGHEGANLYGFLPKRFPVRRKSFPRGLSLQHPILSNSLRLQIRLQRLRHIHAAVFPLVILDDRHP